ncbi:MAG: M20/M25/M40 family metallo-hydrolase, partial [Oscillospiraceae bacterium]
IQLGAAKILSSMREELAGTVRFFFQTGEEVAQGAKLGVENGVMDGVDACLGMHIWGQVDAPRFNIEAGPRMASCDSFTVTVRGTSAHGSAPQFGRDAI